MTLNEWDKRIAPRLNKIQGVSGWLSYYAKDLQSAVTGLEARPAWTTLAREYLNEAEKDLMIALSVVRAARDVYDDLPIIVEHYDRDSFTSQEAAQ